MPLILSIRLQQITILIIDPDENAYNMVNCDSCDISLICGFSTKGRTFMFNWSFKWDFYRKRKLMNTIVIIIIIIILGYSSYALASSSRKKKKDEKEERVANEEKTKGKEQKMVHLSLFYLCNLFVLSILQCIQILYLISFT